MSGIEEFFVHTVTVETYQGTGATGDVFSSPVAVMGFLDGEFRLVRDGHGQEVVSASKFYCTPTDGAKFTPDSRVTVSPLGALAPGALPPAGALVPSSVAGRTCSVIQQNAKTAPGLDLPDHAEIYLK